MKFTLSGNRINWKGGILGMGGGGSPPVPPADTYIPEYQAVYDSYWVKPTDADALAQETFVQTGVTDGWWSDFDRLFIFASQSDGHDSLVDWIHPSVAGNVATKVGLTVFTPFEGHDSYTSDNYINLNFTPSTDGVNYKLNDAAWHIYWRESGSSNNADFGATQTGVSITRATLDNDTGLYSRAASGYLQTTGTMYIFTAPPASVPGMKTGERNASNNSDGYYNGVWQRSDNDASSSLNSIPFYALCENDNGSPGPEANRQMSMIGLSKALGATKNLSFYNAFQTLMTHYGTQV